MTLGVEVRETAIVSAIVDDSGRVTSRGAADISGDVASAVGAAVERLSPKATALSSLGIAMANTDPSTTSRLIDSLTSRRTRAVKRKVVIGSGTAVAVAESWIGAAKDIDDVVYFGVETHATAGVIRAGRAVTGAHSREPVVGWLALNPVEREDYRKSGCLDAEVAAAGIVRRLIWRVKAGDRSRVQDAVGGDLAAITYDLVLEAARAGDGVSISVMRDTAKYLGMAAANLVVMSDPTMLVLGGIMASAGDLLLEPIVWELARRLPGPMMEALKIAPASVGPDAVVIGAARYAGFVNATES
jgi:predicted NBD/HSP70 family sugar kinase